MKFIFIIASILLALPLKAEDSVLKKVELRVLDIGNSYTGDATDFLPLIAEASKAELSTMCLYRCYRGGGSFKSWVDIYNDNDNANTYSISKVVGDLPANVQTGTGEGGDGKLFRDVLSNENWDLIIIHQLSTYAPYYSLWKNKNAAGYLDELISIIKEHQPNAKLGFLLVHSYWSEYEKNTEQSSFERWQLIANSTKSFCEDYNVDFVIPYGTAIQNLRASSLNNEYDLTRDGTHCGYGLAQYTAACCYYESLIAPRSGISVLGNPARIDVSNKTTKYPTVNVTDENAIIAQEAAYLAVKDMYHCQNPESHIFKLTYEVDGEIYKSENMASEMAISPEPEPTKEGYSFSGWSDIPSTMPANDVTVRGMFWSQTSPTISLSDDDSIDKYLMGTSKTLGGFYSTLFPTAASVGIPVTEAVEGHRCGLDVGKLTKSGIAIKALGQAGWELANHTLHARFYGAYELETFSDISKIPEYPNFQKGSVKSNTASIIYVKDEQKNYFYNTNGQWEEQPHGYEQPLLKDYTGAYIGDNPTFDTELEYNENQRRMEQYLNYHPQTFVIPAWSGSQERVIFIKRTHDFVFSQPKKIFIKPPLHTVLHRIRLDADEGTTNEAGDELLESWKQILQPVMEDGASVILGMHAYRTCWSNYLEKELVSNGGSYPDEWVHPVNIPTDKTDLDDLLAPSASTGIQSWDQWHPCPGTRLYQLWRFLKYMKEQGIAFSTIHENVGRMKNKVEEGYFPDMKLQPFDEDNPFYHVIDANGNTYSTSYSLTYLVDGETYKNYKVPYSTSITSETTPTKEGYTFSGWSEIPETMPANDVTITGTFSINKYHLVYKVDGVEYKSYEVEYGASITPEAVPTKEHYTFSGWSEIPEKMPAEDVTIMGSFSLNKHKLDYKVDGNGYKSYEIEYGEEITPEIAPTKEGYTFSGWDDVPETMPDNDVTVSGAFIVNKYKLIYKVDGAEYKSYDLEYGARITPEAAPTKEGYTFLGWSDIPKTMPAKNVTITGSFTQVDYEIEGIKYEVSGNDVSIIEADDTSGDVKISSTVVINDKTYTVTSIADGAFKNNTKMTSVSIPNSVTSIGDNAFKGCSKLSEISIGSAVTAIGSKAFANIKPVATTRGNDGLKISCYALSIPTTAADAFDNTPIGNATLLVDDNFVSSYKSTSPWSGFGTIMGFNEATGIKLIRIDSQKAIIYDMRGNRLDQPQKGVNIIRMNDGTTKKVVVDSMR